MGYPDFSVGEVLTSSDMDRVGLWRIERKTATSGSELVFDSVFTSNFVAYMVMVENCTTAATSAVNIQLRTGGTNATTFYYWGGIYRLFASGGGDNITNNGSFFNVATFSSALGQFNANIIRPQVAAPTYINATASNFDGFQTGSGIHNVSTSYSGFRIYSATSTFTDIRATVYGYNSLA